MKKIIYSMGILSTSFTPLVFAVSCNDEKSNEVVPHTNKEIVDSLATKLEFIYFDLSNQSLYSTKLFSEIPNQYKEVSIHGLSNYLANKSAEAIAEELGISYLLKHLSFYGARISNIHVESSVKERLDYLNESTAASNTIHKMRLTFTFTREGVSAKTKEIKISAFEATDNVRELDRMIKGLDALDDRGWYHFNTPKRVDGKNVPKVIGWTDEEIEKRNAPNNGFIKPTTHIDSIQALNSILNVTGSTGPQDNGYGGALPSGMLTVGTNLTLRILKADVPQLKQYYYDDEGNVEQVEARDEEGNIIPDTSKPPLTKPGVDEDGNPIQVPDLDDDGNPKYPPLMVDYYTSGNSYYLLFTSETSKIRVSSFNPALIRSKDYVTDQIDVVWNAYEDHIINTIGDEIIISDTNYTFTKFENIRANSKITLRQIGLEKAIASKLNTITRSINGKMEIYTVDEVTESSTEVKFKIKFLIENWGTFLSKEFTAKLT